MCPEQSIQARDAATVRNTAPKQALRMSFCSSLHPQGSVKTGSSGVGLGLLGGMDQHGLLLSLPVALLMAYGYWARATHALNVSSLAAWDLF